MNGKHLLRVSLLSAMIALSVAGCSKKSEMSQQQVQFLSHMDQARFFQKQGELKASMQEARSAIELQPQNINPYLLIVDNLITVGDANTAQSQLTELEKHVSADLPPFEHNRIVMDWARSELMKKNYDAALKHLAQFKTPKKQETKQESQADNLKGDILLASGDLKGAADAYNAALKADAKSIDAMVGLSKVAYQHGDKAEAGKQLANALKLDKDNSNAWLWKAQMAQQDQNYATSEDAYVKALDGIGKYDIMTLQKYQTISSLIDVLRAEGKIQEAFVYEEILAKSGPGIVKSNYDAAIKAYKEGNLDKAADHLEEVLKQAPGNEHASLLLGLIRFQQGKVEEAQKILKPLESSDSVQVSKLLAATQIRMGQSQQAQKLLEQLKGSEKDPNVLALVGVAAIGSGQPDVGRKYIEKSLSIKPDNPNLRLRFGAWLMSRNEYAEAAKQAQEALKSKPDLASAHRLEVEAYLRDNNPQKAQAAVSAWHKAQPNSVEAVLTSGDLALSQKKVQQAEEAYQQAARMAPQSPIPQIALGKLKERQNDQNGAIAHYEKAVELAPNDQAALSSLVHASLGNKAQLDKTIAFLQKLAADNPKAAGVKIVLLENALRLGNFKDSEKLADDVMAQAKNQESATNFMASVYSGAAANAIQSGNQDKADKIVQLALKRFPKNLNIGLTHAQVLFAENKENDALNVLRELKKDNPDSDRPYLVEADYRVHKKQYDQAIELYKLALEKSENPDLYIRLANVQTESGQPDKALETLKKAADTYPDAPGVILQLGLAYQAVKKTDDAESTYERLLKLSPDQPVALNNLAWIYQQKGNKKASDIAQRAYELQPNSAPIADTYGWIMFNQGQVKASIQILEKAHKLAPDQKDISLHLAEAYKKNGEQDKAKAVLEKF